MEPDTRARPLARAGALLIDDQGHLLIVEPLEEARWEVPGGAVERGESPRDACLREVHETLGLELPLDKLLVVDWSSRPEEHVRFVFDGGVLTEEQLDAIELSDELESWACVPEEELFVMLAPIVTRLLIAALGARAAGETWYLENGMRVEP